MRTLLGPALLIANDRSFVEVKGGRIAAKGSILGNLVIDGGLDATSALVSAGAIGDVRLGTALTLNGNVKGILAAEASINFGKDTPNTKKAAFSGENLKTTDTVSKAAIDAIFTDMGMALAFDRSGLDLHGLDLLLTDLAALRVGSNGKLTGTKP